MEALAAWVLRRTRQDYETRGQLSTEASIGGWILYLAHSFVTLTAARRSSRTLQVRKDPSMILGGSLILFGSLFYGAAIREFRSFEQVSGTETGNLVTSEPYLYSRNPQVVGRGLTLLGISVWSRSPQALLSVAAFFLLHHLYFEAEEQHLERAFGQEYRTYRTKTPRFLGLPKD